MAISPDYTVVQAGANIRGVTFGAGFIWAADNNNGKILKIDPATQAVVASYSATSNVQSVSYSNGYVWAISTSNSAVYRLDIATGAFSAVVSATPGHSNQYIEVSNGFVWCALYTGGNRVKKFVESTAALAAQVGTVGANRSLAVGGGYVAVPDEPGGVVNIYDTSLTAVGPVTVGTSPFGVAFAADLFWVTHDHVSSGVQVIDPDLMTVVATISVGQKAAWIAAVGSNHVVVALNNTTNSAAIINVHTRSVVDYITAGASMWGVAADGATVILGGGTTIAAYTLNAKPYPPVITTPALNETIDRDVVNRITVPLNDPDPGDTQSKLDIRWWDLDSSGSRVGAAHTHSHSNPQQYWDAPGGTFTVGDKEMQGQSYDSQGEPSGWGPSTFFTAAVAPSPPVITYPANGGNVQQQDRVEWSTPQQDGYHVQILDSNDVLVEDLGQKQSAIPRLSPLTFPDNLVTRKIAVRVLYGGLWSLWAVIGVNVSYVQPIAAVVTCTPDATKGAIQVDWTNSDPGSPVPAPAYVDLYVRTAAADDGKDEYRPYNARGIRIAKDLPPNSGFLDRRPSSGIKYEYNVKTVGDNDTSIDSGWTA